MTTNSEIHWTVGQIAQRWHCRDKRVYNEIRDGQLVAIKLGPKSIRVAQAALEEYEAAHRIRVPEAHRR